MSEFGDTYEERAQNAESCVRSMREQMASLKAERDRWHHDCLVAQAERDDYRATLVDLATQALSCIECVGSDDELERMSLAVIAKYASKETP